MDALDVDTRLARLRRAHAEALDALRRAEDEFYFGQLPHGEAMHRLGEARRREAALAVALAETLRPIDASTTRVDA